MELEIIAEDGGIELEKAPVDVTTELGCNIELDKRFEADCETEVLNGEDSMEVVWPTELEIGTGLDCPWVLDPNVESIVEDG